MEGIFSFLFFIGLIAIIAMIHSIISKIANIAKSSKEKHQLKLDSTVNAIIEKERKELNKEFENRYRNERQCLEQEYQEICMKARAQIEKSNAAQVFYFQRASEAEKKAKEYTDATQRIHADILKNLIAPLRMSGEQQKLFIDSFGTERGLRAVSENMEFFNLTQVECSVRSASGHTYKTTLTSCTCPDHQARHSVCKHMVALAIHINAFLIDPNTLTSTQAIQAEKEKNAIRQAQEADRVMRDSIERRNRIQQQLQVIQEQEAYYQKWKDHTLMTFPWIAEMLAVTESKYDQKRLKTLSPKAYKSAELVKEIKQEKKELIFQLSQYQALLATYEYLFPWLEEFKTLNVEDALKYARSSEASEDYEKNLRSWLSPEEYATLSSTQKNQLALDRYQKRPKSDWEIGIEYERYVGYTYEKQGYRVKYTGATEGLQDMGRDLLVYKSPSEVLVIQCKRWSTEKTIHEKHIFQLFGTAFVLQITNPSVKYVPVFYTTTTLSDVAKKCAEELNVVVYENHKCGEYPLIKCNLGRGEFGDKEKIYHLPFDQQYDRVAIDSSKGEQYVYTVAEAEKLGYRHAMRHLVS